MTNNIPQSGSGWRIFPQRLFAFVIDSLIYISVFTGLIRIFNLFVPGNDVREDPMQLYTQKDFRVFCTTAVVSMLLLALYMLVSYKSKRGQTLGHRVARIRIQRRDGQPIGALTVLRFLAVAWFRVSLIWVPGPLLAFIGADIVTSLFMLIWAIALIIPFPISKSGASIWEIIGNYKFVFSNAKS